MDDADRRPPAAADTLYYYTVVKKYVSRYTGERRTRTAYNFIIYQACVCVQVAREHNIILYKRF